MNTSCNIHDGKKRQEIELTKDQRAHVQAMKFINQHGEILNAKSIKKCFLKWKEGRMSRMEARKRRKREIID